MSLLFTLRCLQDNGEWELQYDANLDRTDELNDVIDRHDCTSIDVNFDTVPDIVCVVGATFVRTY